MSESTERWQRLCTLFESAQRRAPQERAAFVDAACADDPTLRQELRALLDAAEAGEGSAAGEPGAVTRLVGDAAAQVVQDAEATLRGRRIGPYTLVRLLGAGGMGSVYLAQRADAQFEHEVAIKILPSLGTQGRFVERFRAERQMLAGLDHPYIAKLLDGGVTTDGLQYLILEYVRGEPIDAYCDRLQLGVRERLQLVQKLCEAVDYAHRNLVVHRDVKPSNILVTDEGVPKLLDFGIAKVLGDAAMNSGATLASERVMTPEYSSPEQVRGDPVSTATDVYSLGLLLYRLLCGRAPYRDRSGLPTGMLRAILEDTPLRPSLALFELPAPDAPTAQALSALRGTTPARLQRQLRGDLDTIVRKAMHKEPARRYASVQALHDDLESTLAHRPVRARGDGVAYLAGRFVQRHRLGVAMAGLAALLALAATLQIVAQRNRAEAAAAAAQRMSDFLVTMLSSANPYEHAGNPSVRALLDRGAHQIDAELAGQPLVAARLKVTMARAYGSLGEQETAATLARAAIATLDGVAGRGDDRGLALVQAHGVLAQMEYDRQAYAPARDEARAALQLPVAASGSEAAPLAVARAEAQRTLGWALLRLDQPADGLLQARQALAQLRGALGDARPETEAAQANLAAVYNEMGRDHEALPLAREVVQSMARRYGANDLHVAQPLGMEGNILWNLGDFRGAEQAHARQLSIMESALGTQHPALAEVYNALAEAERKLGHEASAATHYERAIALLEHAESPAPGRLADFYGALGILLSDEGHLDRAEPMLRRALALSEQVYGKGNAATSWRLMHLGSLLRRRHQYALARGYFQQAIDAARRRYDENHRTVLIMRMQYAINEGEAGHHAQAATQLAAVLEAVKAHYGAGHPLVGQILVEMATVDVAMHQFARAEQRLQAALAIYLAQRDPTHPDIEEIFHLRARAARGLGHQAQARGFDAEAARVHAQRDRLGQAQAAAAPEAAF